MLPNFMIAGTPRCGTTSLYYFLKQHPEIAFPEVKEPKYFSSLGLDLPQKGPGDITVYRKLVLTFEDYQKLYEGIEAKRVGDASTPCLYYHQFSAKAVKKTLGDIPIVVMLRNPIERAYSAWYNLVRDGRETETFERGLELEAQRLKDNWDMMWAYKDMGLYAEQVKAYQQVFSKVQVLIFEEFSDDPQKVLENVFQFLDVQTDFKAETSQKYSHSGKPKNKLIALISNRNNKFMGDLRNFVMKFVPRSLLEQVASKMFEKDKMSPDVRKELQQFFKKDIQQLESLIGKDLSHWK